MKFTGSSKIVVSLFALGLTLSLALAWLGTMRTASFFESSDKTLGYPRRIICTVPSLVEIVFALGAGDRVIAVGDFTTYPPEAVKKARVGGYINPNLEQVVALRPDLVIVQGKMDKLLALCDQKKIPLLRVENDDLSMLFSAIATIGKTVGCEPEAQRLTEDLRRHLDEIRKQAEAFGKRPKVFLCLDRLSDSLSGFSTAGGGSFPSELLTIAGGENVFGDVTSSLYPQISKEALRRRAPDVIIEFRPDSPMRSIMTELNETSWHELSSLPAVAHGHVYRVTEDFALIPGPRIVRTAERLLELIHRE